MYGYLWSVSGQHQKSCMKYHELGEYLKIQWSILTNIVFYLVYFSSKIFKKYILSSYVINKKLPQKIIHTCNIVLLQEIYYFQHVNILSFFWENNIHTTHVIKQEKLRYYNELSAHWYTYRKNWLYFFVYQVDKKCTN